MFGESLVGRLSAQVQGSRYATNLGRIVEPGCRAPTAMMRRCGRGSPAGSDMQAAEAGRDIQAAAAPIRCNRLAALVTARSEAVTMSLSMPTPKQVGQWSARTST